MRAGDACPIRTHEWLPPGFSPLPCSWHHESEDGLLTLWPDEYRTWAASRGLLESDRVFAAMDRTPRRSARGDVQKSSVRRLEITTPADGATYLIDPTLRMDFQTLSLRAVGAAGQVEWSINGRRVGRALADGNVTWPLERGKHLVRVLDAHGRVAEASMVVR
jgi:membrane carboxypeptidase/penicillin-binding protein PbpC